MALAEDLKISLDDYLQGELVSDIKEYAWNIICKNPV